MSTVVKINLSIMGDRTPEKIEHKGPSLEDRIDYAIECIDFNMPNKKRAIEFLQTVHGKLCQLSNIREEQQVLIDKIKPVLGEFGAKHLPDAEDSEEGEY